MLGFGALFDEEEAVDLTVRVVVTLETFTIALGFSVAGSETMILLGLFRRDYSPHCTPLLNGCFHCWDFYSGRFLSFSHTGSLVEGCTDYSISYMLTNLRSVRNFFFGLCKMSQFPKFQNTNIFHIISL